MNYQHNPQFKIQNSQFIIPPPPNSKFSLHPHTALLRTVPLSFGEGERG